MIDVPATAYRDFSRGEISVEELQGLEAFADGLSKIAGMPASPFPPPQGGAMGVAGNIGQGIQMGLGLAATTLVGTAAMAGAKAVHNKLTYRRDLNRLLAVRPDIKNEHSQKDIDLAFNSMRMLNPQFAKDPLTGSTLLQQILRNRDIHDPSAPPRMDLGVAKELFTAERRGRDPMQEAVVRSFQAGGEAALRDHLDRSRQRSQFTHQEYLDSERDRRQVQRDATTFARDSKFKKQMVEEDKQFRSEQSTIDRDHRQEQAHEDRLFRMNEGATQRNFQAGLQQGQFAAQQNLEQYKAQLAQGAERLKARLGQTGGGRATDPAELQQERQSLGLPVFTLPPTP